MAQIIEGQISGLGLRIGIVVSRFNEWITKAMLDGALNELRRMGVSDADLKVVWVPGAYEIPYVCQTLCESKKIDAFIAIGCIIRGETSHYEHLAQSVSDGILKVALEQKIPVGFGVMTVENMAQALDRSGGKHGNKGRDAAKSAVEMIRISAALKNDKEFNFKEWVEQEVKPVRDKKTF